MLWFTVWAVLVVGTLVGGFFLVRRVWRSGRSLLGELECAAEALSRREERAEELATVSKPAPVDLLDPEPARARLTEARGATQRRRARRAERHLAVYRGWQALSR